MSLGWSLIALALLALNGYIGFCLWRMPFRSHRRRKALICQVVHVGLTVPCLYYFYRFFSHRAGTHLTDLLSYEAAFCLMTLIYGALFFLLADLVRLLGRRVRYPLTLRSFAARLYRQGLPVFLAAALVAGYSLYHSRDLEVTSYSLALPRGSSSLSSLRAVLVADTHLGTAVKIPELEQMVATIQALEPDVVFLCGDLFDEGTTDQQIEQACAQLGSLQTRYGIYAVSGNHDHTSGRMAQAKALLEQAGICLLADETVTVEDAFVLAGRLDDASGQRAPLESVLAGAPSHLPLLLLDHRPKYQEPAQDGRVDLLLCGHTHNGQIFPMNLFDFLPTLFYGSYEKDGLQTVVTCGAGTWGIPARLGSSREVVLLDLTLTP